MFHRVAYGEAGVGDGVPAGVLLDFQAHVHAGVEDFMLVGFSFHFALGDAVHTEAAVVVVGAPRAKPTNKASAF